MITNLAFTVKYIFLTNSILKTVSRVALSGIKAEENLCIELIGNQHMQLKPARTSRTLHATKDARARGLEPDLEKLDGLIHKYTYI